MSTGPNCGKVSGHAFLFADRVGEELVPLTEKTCVAMLMVAGKPLIEYSLEDLVTVGVTAVTVIISRFGRHVREHLGNGDRWGLEITYFVSRGEESPGQVIRRIGWSRDGGSLLLRGDVLRPPAARVTDIPGAHGLVHCRSGRPLKLHASGIVDCTSPLAHACANALAWTLRPAKLSVVDVADEALFPSGALTCLDDFRMASLDALNGRIPGLIIPGRTVVDGVRRAPRGALSRAALDSVSNAFIGRSSFLGRGVRLEADVVIGDFCVVDEGTRIVSSVIMPNSYVGPDQVIENAVVDGEFVHSSATRLAQRPRIAVTVDLKTVSLRRRLSRIASRTGGALLLAVSAPLWPAALIASRRAGGGTLFDSDDLRSNLMTPRGTRRPVLLWRTGIPVLRNLPLLFCVARGDIDIFGTRPSLPAAVAEGLQATRRLVENSRAGLLGSAQVDCLPDDDERERLLADAVYAVQKNWSENLRVAAVALRLLFTRAAWRDSGARNAIEREQSGVKTLVSLPPNPFRGV